MIEAFTYAFMQKALITGVLIALACSLLGVFLVLRRLSLLGDGLAHISFGGLAFGMLFGFAPFISALLFSAAASLGIAKLKESAKVESDAALGVVSHAALGLGVFVASVAGGYNVDLLSYLFGSILAISPVEVWLTVLLAITVIGAIALNYYDLVFLTFDESSAKTSGIKTRVLSAMLVLLTALTIVMAMRITGLLLASAMLVLPASAALQISSGFKRTLALSAAIAVSSVIVGLMLAFYLDLAVSGTIVLLNFAVFLSSLGLKRARIKI